MAKFEDYLQSLTVFNGKTKLGARFKENGIDIAANQAYILRGDHWQNATAWNGPPVPADMKDGDKVLAGVARDFTPVPLIEEVDDRHMTGLVGREFSFEMLDKESEDLREAAADKGDKKSKERSKFADEVNGYLTNWFDEKEGLRLAQDYTHPLIYAGHSSVRLFIPRERLDDKGKPVTPIKKGDIEAAAKLIFADALPPDVAGVIIHRQSMREIGIAVLDQIEVQKDGDNLIEVGTQEIELQYVNEQNKKTVIKVGANAIEVQNDERLLIFEGSRLGGPLITEPIRALQRSIDMMNSMLGRNAKFAGHRERTYFNVAETRDPVTKEPVDPIVGAGYANYLNGQEYIDTDNKKKFMPPSLVYGEPVDSGPIRADIEKQTRDLLRAARQLHALMSDDATASGVSRVQAMADYIDSLLKTRPAIEAMLRWLFKTVLLVSAHLADDAEFAAKVIDMRCRVDLRLPTGNLSPDEKRILMELFQAGLVSKETVLVMLGVEDVDAELAKLEEEAKEQAALNPAPMARAPVPTGPGLVQSAA